MSRWMASAQPAHGGLFIPGKPRRHAADLVVADRGLVLSAGGIEVELPWTSGGTSRSARGQSDVWDVRPLSYFKTIPIGVAIYVHGPHADGARPVSAATRTWRNWLHQAFLSGSVVIPLWAGWFDAAGMRPDLETFAALCAALEERPAWRAGLADPAVVRRLAADLRTRSLQNRSQRTGIGRASTEVRTALHVLGYAHGCSGRPLPGDLLPSEGEVTGAVIDWVHRSPCAKDLDLDPEKVRRIVRRDYIDVDPWPFAALASRPLPGGLPAEPSL